jgi:hypothetical protein
MPTFSFVTCHCAEQAYTSRCRYWELNALAGRWFYLALLPGLFPYHHPGQVRRHVTVTVYFSAAAVVMTLTCIRFSVQVFLAIGATMLFLQVRCCICFFYTA